MAGGFGTRLRPLTCHIPKPLVPMVNRSIMEYVVELLKTHGFDDVTVMLYHQPEHIQNFFGNGEKFGVKMRYLRPDSDVGTAGCVKFAEKFIKDEWFLVISADLLTDFNLSSALEFAKKKNTDATIVLTSIANPLPFGVVITDEEGKITRFLEKPSWGEVFSDTINTGIYVLNSSVFKLLPSDKSYDFSKDLYPDMLKKNKRLYGYVAQGAWRDIGNLDEYRTTHYAVLDGTININIPGRKTVINNYPVWVDDGAVVDKSVEFTGPVVIGKSAKIGAGTKIGRTVIGERSVIGEDCNVTGAIVWNDVVVGRNTRLIETTIVEKTVVGEESQLREGTFIGTECELGKYVEVRPNVRIWPKKVVEEQSIVSTSLVWGEKWSKTLFGAYGITGLANIEITPEFAARVGAAYGAYIGKGKYVITSRDEHPVSRMIKRTMISGLLSMGVKVGDMRSAPIPVVRYEMGKEGESGAIHIRKSPFDPRLVDIKFLDANGSDISVRQEKSIEQLFLREDFERVSPEDVGEIVLPPRVYEYYREGFLKTIDKDRLSKANLKIVIDYAYSSASMVFPSILGELGCEVVALNSFVNPHKVTKSKKEFEHSLEQLSDIVVTLKADAGFLIDTGAEKVFIVDDRGKIIPDDWSLVLIARMMMEKFKNAKICIPLNTSQIVEELASKYGAKVMRTRMSPQEIMQAGRGEGIVFAGDGVGGFIFPEFQPAFDAMFSIVKILELMVELDIRMSRLARSIPDFSVHHVQVPCSWEKKGLLMRKFAEEAQGKKAEFIEGVKIFMDNEDWVLLVPDPDKPFFHVWVEAETRQKVGELISEYETKVRDWQK